MELAHSSGSFSDGVLCEVTWEDELDSGLDVAAGDGVLVLVSVELGGLKSDSLEQVSHERVHDAHGSLGDSDFVVDVLEHSVDVDTVAVELLSSDSLLSFSTLCLSASYLCFSSSSYLSFSFYLFSSSSFLLLSSS